MFRPGPDRITPGTASGGVVLRVYKRNGTMLVERPLRAVDQAAAEADAAKTLEAFTPGDPVELCLVCYDGDTGARWKHDDWVRIPGWENEYLAP
jgi:hypothetical protein